MSAPKVKIPGLKKSRPFYLREEDYESATLENAGEGDAFAQFWLRDVYGGEITTPFTLSKFLNGYNNVFQGNICRRDPRFNEPVLDEMVFLVDIDWNPAAVRIPPEVWGNAFEARPGGRRALRLNPTSLEGWDNLPRTSIQVVLVSARTGLVIKGPLTLLLLLAQDKYPLETIGATDLDHLQRAWQKLWALKLECDRTARQHKGKVLPVNPLCISMELPKKRVTDLFTALVSRVNPFLLSFVDDAWFLRSGPDADEIREDLIRGIQQEYRMRKKGFIEPTVPDILQQQDVQLEPSSSSPGTPAQAPAGTAVTPSPPPPSNDIGSPPASPPRDAPKSSGESTAKVNALSSKPGAHFKQGDPYVWVPVCQGTKELELYVLWLDNPRIVRSRRLGTGTYINTSYAKWAKKPEKTWKRLEAVPLLGAGSARLPPIDATQESQRLKSITTLLSSLPPPVVATPSSVLSSTPASEAAAGFAQFYTEVFKHGLNLQEWHPGYAVFQDVQNKTNIVVRLAALPECMTGHVGGIASLEIFFNFPRSRGGKVRFFAFSPGDTCVEEDLAPLRKLAPKWLGPYRMGVSRVAQQVASLQQKGGLLVDVLLGDPLLNPVTEPEFQPPAASDRLAGAWLSEPSGKFTPLFSPFEVRALRKVLTDIYTLAQPTPPAEPTNKGGSPEVNSVEDIIAAEPTPTGTFRRALAWKKATLRGIQGPAYLTEREIRALLLVLEKYTPPPVKRNPRASLPHSARLPAPIEISEVDPAIGFFTSFQAEVFKHDVSLVVASDHVAEFRAKPRAGKVPIPKIGSKSSKGGSVLVYLTPPVPFFGRSTPGILDFRLATLISLLLDKSNSTEVYIAFAREQVVAKVAADAIFAELEVYVPDIMRPLHRAAIEEEEEQAESDGKDKKPGEKEDKKTAPPQEEGKKPTPNENLDQSQSQIPPASFLSPPLFFGYDFRFIEGIWRYDEDREEFSSLPLDPPLFEDFIAFFTHLEQSVYNAEVQLWDDDREEWTSIDVIKTEKEINKESKKKPEEPEGEGKDKEEFQRDEINEEVPEDKINKEDKPTNIDKKQGKEPSGKKLGDVKYERESGEEPQKEQKTYENAQIPQEKMTEPEIPEGELGREEATIRPSKSNVVLASVRRHHPETGRVLPPEYVYVANLDADVLTLDFPQPALQGAVDNTKDVHICFISGQNRRILKTTAFFLLLVSAGDNGVPLALIRELGDLLNDITHTAEDNDLNYVLAIQLALRQVFPLFQQNFHNTKLDELKLAQILEAWDFGVVWHPSYMNPDYIRTYDLPVVPQLEDTIEDQYISNETKDQYLSLKQIEEQFPDIIEFAQSRPVLQEFLQYLGRPELKNSSIRFYGPTTCEIELHEEKTNQRFVIFDVSPHKNFYILPPSCMRILLSTASLAIPKILFIDTCTHTIMETTLLFLQPFLNQVNPKINSTITQELLKYYNLIDNIQIKEHIPVNSFFQVFVPSPDILMNRILDFKLRKEALGLIIGVWMLENQTKKYKQIFPKHKATVPNSK